MKTTTKQIEALRRLRNAGGTIWGGGWANGNTRHALRRAGLVRTVVALPGDELRRLTTTITEDGLLALQDAGALDVEVSHGLDGETTFVFGEVR